MNTDISTSRAKGNTIIRHHSRSQLRTFFDELKNGTQFYRTLVSLDSQVVQEYQGRCIIELLQNAYDALHSASSDVPRLIKFVLTTSPEPVLLVGNSGQPFSKEDFRGLCQLGQSPKNPNQSVGNKGLGFRSVYEVSSCPEIWSSAPSLSAPSFVFSFNPSVLDRVAAAARKLEESEIDVWSPFDPEFPLVDWSASLLAQYRERAAHSNFDIANEVKEALSPYQFPLPVKENRPEVAKLLAEGFVTVVRLPLDGGMTGTCENAVQSVKNQLEELNAGSMIFLHHIEALVVEIDGVQRILERIVDTEELINGCGRTLRERLLIGSSGPEEENTTRQFYVWRRKIGGNEDPAHAEQIRDKVKHLPNPWPKVEIIELGVAVEDVDSPGNGSFVIFLPTEMTTGTGAHINAPFFGSINRRQIDFMDDFNKFLLDNTLDLCLDVVADLASEERPTNWQAKAVIDILSSTTKVDNLDRSITECLRTRALERDWALEEWALILCDNGWRVPSKARLMPANVEENALGPEHWRKHAGFAVVSPVLEGRRDAVKKLLIELDCLPDPTNEEWVQTVERVADCVRCSEIKVSWDKFLNGVVDLLPENLGSEPRTGFPDPLVTAKFLPDQNGRLIRAAGDVKIFFQPVRNVDDAADFANKVPDCLKDRIAFLHPDIQTQEGQPRKNTKVQKFLDGRFVRGFGREVILRDVIVPALPDLPVSHDSEKEAGLCSELLFWTMKLLGKNPNETPLELLGKIPVACHGGWYAMRDTGFGPGWPNLLGDLVRALAEELPASASFRLLETFLLHPEDMRWGGTVDVVHWSELFARSGIAAGLRPRKVEQLRFEMQGDCYALPHDAPAGIPIDAWNDWRAAACEEAKPRFAGRFTYSLSDVYFIPELHLLEHLNSNGRNAFSRLLLTSLENWPDDWQVATIRKLRGMSSSWKIISPLKHWLKTIPWLNDGMSAELKLSRRWLVPTSRLRGVKDRFQHLKPLSSDLARKIVTNRGLFDLLKDLGLNVYPEENDQIGPELLEALATAWAKDSVPSGHFDVFLGQIRDAWRHFDQNRDLPKKFIVRTGPRKFSVRKRSNLADVFLPDNSNRAKSLKDHRKFLLEMRVRNATDLAETLLTATDIRKASSLEERRFVDGSLWKDAGKQIPSLEDSKFKWLPVPLLAVAAHGGINPSGPETNRWRNALERLQRTRQIDCEEIKVQLVDGDKVLAEGNPDALWLPGDVLAIRRDVNTSYEKLAPAAEMLLDRQDILKDLRLVLGNLKNQENPTFEQIKKALENIEVEPEELEVVCKYWIENTSFIADRIRPVLELLKIPRNGFESASERLETLTDWLNTNVQQWPTPEMLEAARKSQDDHAMGLEAWCALGDIAALPAWNVALSTLGERYTAVENDAADQQAKQHLAEARPLLLAFARYVAIKEEKLELFKKLDLFSKDFQYCVEWRQQWWKVPFSAVIDAMRVGYSKFLKNGGFLDLLEGIESADDLRAAFRKKKISVDPSPYDIARQNHSRFERIFFDVYDIYQAWIARDGSEPIASEPPQLPADLNPEAYLRQWSETEIIERSIRIIDNKAFASACDGCFSLFEIRCRLQLNATAVENKRHERQERKREKERQDRIVNVAGMAFEKGSTDYGQLWEHLENSTIPIGPDVSKDEFTPLEKLTGSSSPKRVERNRMNANLQLQFSEHPELVGIAGEAYAFNVLRNKFGQDVVTQAAWVSANRLKVFPLVEGEPNETSDSLGFDFRFTCGGKHWHVEVKSTDSDDSQFEIGISEIKAAIFFSKEDQGQRWRILRFRKTLSNQPKFDWLPNPFHEQNKSLFRIDTSGMRVSYTRK